MMYPLPPFKLLKLAFLLLLPCSTQVVQACSGYKLTHQNVTILGSNEDAWRTTPHIWFENAKQNSKYGAAFTGSRFDGKNGYAPQSGMNEMGLAFERLASYHPSKKSPLGKKKITNPTKYLKEILHNCKNVEEVRDFISNYDFSYFIEDVFLYVDKAGNYLVVEPYSMQIGKDASYVISNFCPSITSEQQAKKLDRYRNGLAYLKKGFNSSLAFCRALSDTMHVCREKIGDGTLLSSIWNLNEGLVHLYFYHDYQNSVQFNLAEELRRGDHQLAIERLFPRNKEFEQLRNYKTPKNSSVLGVFIVFAGILFFFSSLFFTIRLWRMRKTLKNLPFQFLIIAFGFSMSFYMLILSGSVNVFYLPAPYTAPRNIVISLTSYLPFVLILVIIPLWVYARKTYRDKTWKLFPWVLLTTTILSYIALIPLFFYWGFYTIFS